MEDAILKAWPILAGLAAGGGGALAWIGVGVWRVSRWTSDHDSRVAEMRGEVGRISLRADRLEARTDHLCDVTSRHDAILLARHS
jgi:hypothetical protein